MDDKKFLIRIGAVSTFVVELGEDGKPLCVYEPCRATHMTYPQADEMCQYLRSVGFYAIVTNIWGEPCGLDEIKEALAPTEECSNG